MKKIVLKESTTENIVVDEDGVVLSSTTSRKVITTLKKDSFIQVFTAKIKDWCNLSRSQHSVLIALWNRAEKDTNRVFLVKQIKEEIAAETELAVGSVKNAITVLIRRNLIINLSSSLYVLNPQYFFNGSEVARSKCIEFIFEFKFVEEEQNEQ
mgnify:CR=1 FL=1